MYAHITGLSALCLTDLLQSLLSWQMHIDASVHLRLVAVMQGVLS